MAITVTADSKIQARLKWSRDDSCPCSEDVKQLRRTTKIGDQITILTNIIGSSQLTKPADKAGI